MKYLILYLLVGVLLSIGLTAIYMFDPKSKELWEREFGERTVLALVILDIVITFCWLPTLLLIGFWVFKERSGDGERG